MTAVMSDPETPILTTHVHQGDSYTLEELGVVREPRRGCDVLLFEPPRSAASIPVAYASSTISRTATPDLRKPTVSTRLARFIPR